LIGERGVKRARALLWAIADAQNADVAIQLRADRNAVTERLRLWRALEIAPGAIALPAGAAGVLEAVLAAAETGTGNDVIERRGIVGFASIRIDVRDRRTPKAFRALRLMVHAKPALADAMIAQVQLGV
jgi:hypothetical protein